jgi:xanthine dehydrogenase accessory factor
MALVLFERPKVWVRGGGDIASGVIYRLVRAGFSVIVSELENPLLVRRAVSYGSAVYEGIITVEGLTAILVVDLAQAQAMFQTEQISVIIDPQGKSMRQYQPDVVVDARLAKRNIDTLIDDAGLVIGLGPGFEAGVDCHAVVETNRGHHLGRVYWEGSAEPDTGQPGAVNGVTNTRVLRAPQDGYVIGKTAIGEHIQKGQVIAHLQTDEHASGIIPIVAQFDGVLRGIIHQSVHVTTGYKIGDLDPRNIPANCFTISEKSLAVGGGVLEAILSANYVRKHLSIHRD